MVKIENTTCFACHQGKIVRVIGDSLGFLAKKHGGVEKIPEAKRIEACKCGETAALIEARHFEGLARKARKRAAQYALLQTEGMVFDAAV
jgi:hypothetical protein